MPMVFDIPSIFSLSACKRRIKYSFRFFLLFQKVFRVQAQDFRLSGLELQMLFVALTFVFQLQCIFTSLPLDKQPIVHNIVESIIQWLIMKNHKCAPLIVAFTTNNGAVRHTKHKYCIVHSLFSIDSITDHSPFGDDNNICRTYRYGQGH